MSGLLAQRLLTPGAVGIDPDVAAWSAAVVSGGGTVSSARKALVSGVVQSLKLNGVWTSLDRLWLFAAENSTQALIDLVARSTATATNSPTFTANQGYAGNGTTSYVDTNYNPSSTGPNFTQNSSHFSVWQRVASSVGSAGQHGCINADGLNSCYMEFTAGANGAHTWINAPGGANQTVTAGVGMLIGNRTGAAVTNAWYNGSKGTTGVTASQAPQNLTLWIGANNFNGAVNAASNAQVMFVSIGAGLTDAQAAALFTALTTYKTAVGA